MHILLLLGFVILCLLPKKNANVMHSGNILNSLLSIYMTCYWCILETSRC